MLREMLLFLREVVDDFPVSCKRALYAAECSAGPKRIKGECPDPFAACEAEAKRVIELSKADLAAIYDLVGSGGNLGLFNRLRAAMHEAEVK